MDIDIGALHSARAKLANGFEKLASYENISLELSDDTRTLDLCGRLYDATVGDRRINIDYNPKAQIVLDSFIKDFDSEIGFTRLLTVSVNEVGLDVHRLWSIAKGWLYDRMPEDSTLFA